ncbi:MAG: type II toxin-antitoxin system RelE/ParE family toxin [Lachnospiraceae bacterium]|nr:type II toxin-antitoxin system RelE/ParE family toxin [Lachnospiraceae bacterium]MBD5482162.1 type II toxin-antitoxin system RelE/ParE family toxin [Lachnospiraceae bacterium]
MPKLIYTPKALDDLQEIKAYVAGQFGEGKSKACTKEITSTVKQLELFPKGGLRLADLIEYPTDYYYLVVKPNYVFYRVEGDTVRVIRILNEKQDFLQILFGINSISEEGEDYWENT